MSCREMQNRELLWLPAPAVWLAGGLSALYVRGSPADFILFRCFRDDPTLDVQKHLESCHIGVLRDIIIVLVISDCHQTLSAFACTLVPIVAASQTRPGVLS